MRDEVVSIVRDELNVKEVRHITDVLTQSSSDGLLKPTEAIIREIITMALDVEITPELKLEGQMRELVRHIQEVRKKAGFEVDDRIEVYYQGGSHIFNRFESVIKQEVLANELKETAQELQNFDYSQNVKVDGEAIVIWLVRH
jgi:isoleucyl-tRNA synthetase